MTKTSNDKRSHQRMTREDWIVAAKSALLSGGVEQVKVDRLAKDLSITRGSFYWFFKSREELLDALLKDWERTNTTPLLESMSDSTLDPKLRFQQMMQIWLDEKDFSPAYDSAIRDWARTSPKVERSIRRIDSKRIDSIKDIFVAFGYSDDEAFIRARITYFHQVGYYALHIKETKETRKEFLGYYFKTLTGLEP